MASESIDCCVTSPPYYGLRSYLPEGHPDKALEIGSEATVEEWVQVMVEVFREVRRVLKPQGTIFLNLGDSYAGTRGAVASWPSASSIEARDMVASRRRDNEPIPRSDTKQRNYKPKDMLGQPWLVAKALQQPYYTGKIRSEADRVWLAAIIDGEGCFFIHKRKAGGLTGSKFTRSDGEEVNYARTADTFGVGLEICNTNKAIIDRVQAIVGAGSVNTQGPEQNNRRKQMIYRWRVSPNEAKRVAQECYPHLVGKQHQARLLFNCPSAGQAGAAAHQAMMDLHNGVATAVDYPPPPSLYEPGFYLRQEIIWAKKNPMPESARDRFTKAHEHIFLLSKSERYYFNFKAVQEPVSGTANARRALPDPSGWARGNVHTPAAHQTAKQHRKTNNGVGFGHGFDAQPKPRTVGVNPKAAMAGRNDSAYTDGKSESLGRGPGWRVKQNGSMSEAISGALVETRNPRTVQDIDEDEWLQFLAWKAEQQVAPDVWNIPTHPFKGAHFATFPPALARKCLQAGCPPGGRVLDPFGGSGTVGLEADRLQMDAVLIDLDARNEPMARDRIEGDGSLFAEVQS
jgi:DNA modification methylase